MAFFRRALFALFFMMPAVAFAAPCEQEVKLLREPIKVVQNLGGLFVLFDQAPALSGHSALAIQLDSRMLKFLHTLNYLCETRRGVPLNELAAYVTRKVGELGEDGFREMHVTLGRSKKEIELWIAFSKTAREMKKRTLDDGRLQATLDDAKPYFDRYLALAQALASPGKGAPLLDEARALAEDLTAFLSTSPYLKLALKEKAQVPYWDYDENHGGS